MSKIAVTEPYALKTATATFTLEDSGALAQDFSSHIVELTLIPTSDSTSITAIDGTTIQEASMSSWNGRVGLIQDLAQSGFMRWLFDNEGKKAKGEFTFKDGTDPLSITLLLRPSEIGGPAGGQISRSTVTLPGDGRPQWGSAGA